MLNYIVIFPISERTIMTQIEVGGEKYDIGGIASFVENNLLITMVAKAPIAQWARSIHEVIGRGVFADYITCMVESDKAMKFVFINSDLSHEMATSLVISLITQAAGAQHERELNKARRQHPSAGDLVVRGTNRYHNDKTIRWVNKPQSVRKR